MESTSLEGVPVPGRTDLEGAGLRLDEIANLGAPVQRRNNKILRAGAVGQ